MKNRMLLIVPTRKRATACDELLTAFEETAECSDILFGIDDDDKSDYSSRVLEKSSVNPRLRMGGTLNLLANANAEDYEFLSFMGDDHRPRTQGWDRILSEAIGERPGVAYGDDLLQGVNLPTAVTMSAEIVRRIGYMVPPALVHMYMDNFWRDFGVKIGNLQYRADVVIEHMHYLAGKAINDLQYQEVNASHVYEKDRIAYEDYQKTQMDSDASSVLRK
jgi:hypothetical protein